MSHEQLLKYSEIDLLIEFKDIFLYAVSSKLNYFDSQDFLTKYQFNLNPRNSYTERVNNLSVIGIANLSKLQQSARPSLKLPTTVSPQGKTPAAGKSLNTDRIDASDSSPFNLVDPAILQQMNNNKMMNQFEKYAVVVQD